MIKYAVTVGSLALLVLTGCTSHLIFVEEAHVGLKAKLEPNNPAPAQLSLGYRRGVVAVIPQQSSSSKGTQTAAGDAAANADGPKVVTIIADPNELMSLYTVFNANVGFGDPVAIRHFLATGTAASSLLANDGELRKITDALKDAPKGGQ